MNSGAFGKWMSGRMIFGGDGKPCSKEIDCEKLENFEAEKSGFGN